MFSAGESDFWQAVWRDWLRVIRVVGCGLTRQSSRRLAAALGTNHMSVSRVWTRHGLQPHRVRRYMLSEDPDFEKKAAEIIGPI